jgi:4-hydroxy-3-polyprenylbenzoate decarboxylase
MSPIPPTKVESGPVSENVLTGKDIDVLQFPAPKWHEHDGGRYIGTGCVVITQDPDDGWVNLGTYRVMVHDRDTVGLYISPGKHGRIHREKCFSRGVPLKVAISLGQDPLLFLGSCMEIPHGMSEYDFIGGWRGRPVEVIEGEFSGLPIPARAELVIEGECRPDIRIDEGPFGEFTGYYASAVRAEPVVKIKAIYHRDDPIILGYPPSKPPNESIFVLSYYRSAMIWDELEQAGVPEVRGVWSHRAGAARMFTVVAIRQRYPGHARQAGLIAANCHANAYLGRFTVVVDDDVDITDINDVVWALSTRCDPETGLEVIRRCWSGPLDPIIPKGRKGFNSRAVLDACRPFEWMKEFPVTVEISDQVKDETLKKWGEKIFNR